MGVNGNGSFLVASSRALFMADSKLVTMMAKARRIPTVMAATRAIHLPMA